MSNSITHAGLPYPIKAARFTVQIPYKDSSGAPSDPGTPDTEISKDGGTFADCVEEVTTIAGTNGSAYITLTGDELNCSAVFLAAKAASGPKTTLAMLSPRVLPVLTSGTAQAGSGSTLTLASGASDRDKAYVGCILKTTGGTGGGGGSGARDNQARIITGYVGATRAATVEPAWETAPDNTTTYEVLMTELAGNVAALGGSGPAVDSMQRAVLSTCVGTVGSGSTTTSVVSSALTPGGIDADQFKGRVIVFSRDTATAALRGQATVIESNTAAAAPTFTVTALSRAPASGDTFTIQ